MNVKLGILKALKALLETEHLHVLTATTRYVMLQVHVLQRRDHHKKNFLGLLVQDVAMIKVLHLFSR